MTDFAFDEDRELANLAQPAALPDWSAIIPEADRLRFEEEQERLKAQNSLKEVARGRDRKKNKTDASDSESGGSEAAAKDRESESDDGLDAGRKKKPKKASLLGFSEAEVKK